MAILNVAEIAIGQKVHYKPAHYRDDQWENGMVKEVPDHTTKSLRVVYNCAGEWHRFKDYTSALTSTSDLNLGWKHAELTLEEQEDE